MSKQWFYSHEKQKVTGPCSSDELKKLAASGRLTALDRVWGGRMLRPIKAGSIKGLALSLKLGARKLAKGLPPRRFRSQP